MTSERLQHAETATSWGELMAEISRSMVQLYKELYGKGPTKARTYITDDLVVCLLEGGFHRGERALLEHGQEEPVVTHREAVQETMRDRFVELIEQLVERKVVSFISGVDAATETSADLFVLDSPGELTARHEQIAREIPGEASGPDRPRGLHS
jgi:uncharacterized protein YbcI